MSESVEVHCGSSRTIRTLIVSRVRLYRDGLTQSLDRYPGIEVAQTCDTVADAVGHLDAVRPDVALLDVGAMDDLRNIAQRFRKTKVIAMGLSEFSGDVIACAEAGVSGFVFRDSSVEDLVEAMKNAVHEKLQCSQRVSAMLLARVATLSAAQPETALELKLTRREYQVARLIAEGLTNKEISRCLSIEVPTVKCHVHNLLGKMRVRTRGEAAARLRSLGTVVPRRPRPGADPAPRSRA